MGKTRQPLAILVSDWQKLRKSLKLEVQMIIIQHDRIRKNGDFFLDPHKTSFLKSIC
jgi:hypothetical protein